VCLSLNEFEGGGRSVAVPPLLPSHGFFFLSFVLSFFSHMEKGWKVKCGGTGTPDRLI